MYFYEIEVYHPLLSSKKIIMMYKECFDNHQLNIIVQEAFDECIEKYCNKPLLEDGEEACKMEVETIFKEYLPLQLKNHGFESIEIDETCSLLGGELFVGNRIINRVLKDRYKDMVIPPCKKCIRDECIVPNIRKNSLRCDIEPFDENEEENNKDDFSINALKQYFINFKKSIGKIENLETRLKLLSDFTEDFTQQINRSIMVENQILITKLNSIKKLLNDLYEGIDEYYTETLERNDELAIACADAQLQLIKEIIDKMEEI